MSDRNLNRLMTVLLLAWAVAVALRVYNHFV